MYFNAIVISIAFVIAGLLRIGSIFKDKSQEKNAGKIIPKEGIKASNRV